MAAAPLPYMSAEDLAAAVSWPQAITALTQTIAGGSDLTGGVPRTAVPTEHGELLLMPAESGGAVGVKLLSVAPGNPAAGLPRIQALYVVMDAITLTPHLLLDGAALTALRTPALSALAADSPGRGQLPVEVRAGSPGAPVGLGAEKGPDRLDVEPRRVIVELVTADRGAWGHRLIDVSAWALARPARADLCSGERRTATG